MGQRASNQIELHFENAEVPVANLLGKEGMGFIIAMKTLDQTRAAVAAGGVGVARAAYEIALDYAKTRIQFGSPIIMNQGVSFMLADMAVKIEASRLLTYQAAWMTDHQIKNSKQSAISKTFATDTAMEVATDAVQILGVMDTVASSWSRNLCAMPNYSKFTKGPIRFSDSSLLKRFNRVISGA